MCPASCGCCYDEWNEQIAFLSDIYTLYVWISNMHVYGTLWLAYTDFFCALMAKSMNINSP